MTQTDREIGSRWFEQVWNQGRREAVVEMLAPHGVLHEAGEDSMGPEGFYPFFDSLQMMFSDFRVTVEDTIAEGDRICLRWVCQAKHTGAGMGMDATGVTINVTGLSVLRIENQMMVEAWQNWDMLGMMEQLRGTKTSAFYVAAV